MERAYDAPHGRRGGPSPYTWEGSVQFKRSAVGDAFVIIGDTPSDFESKVSSAIGGTVEPVAGRTGMVVVRGVKGDEDRRRLADLAGGAGVQPLLRDASGAELLPTGQLRVTFVEPPSDESLRHFSAKHQVKLAARNKWQPKVSDFTLTPNDDRTVVDIAEALSHDKDVEAAWPDVLGSFKRE